MTAFYAGSTHAHQRPEGRVLGARVHHRTPADTPGPTGALVGVTVASFARLHPENEVEVYWGTVEGEAVVTRAYVRDLVPVGR